MFLTGFLSAPFQPRACQPSIQRLLKAFTTYCESEWTSTAHGRLRASSAAMGAMSSMRLLVVRRYPQLSSLRCSSPFVST